MDDDGGRWLEELTIPPLPSPLPEWIEVPGAVALAIHTPRGERPYRWERCIAAAWARSPATDTWGVLLAWECWRRLPDGVDRIRPRFGWYRFDPGRVMRLNRTTEPNPWALAWWGTPDGRPIRAALELAAGSLPERLRHAAVRPAGDGPLAGVPSLRAVPPSLHRPSKPGA